ncbi:hypothetical protein Tsubulata_006499, partial [Turnera subulata]
HYEAGEQRRRRIRSLIFFFQLVDVLLVLALLCDAPLSIKASSHCRWANSGDIRPHSVSVTEFGAVGDGVTLNTKAFQNAIFYLNSFSDKGGAKLFVPAGRWLTGSFDLISHLTLWLDKDAVILGSTNSDDWPVVDPLPSYGRGRELPGSLALHAGDNGTIDGQGGIWWNCFLGKSLNYTRPHLVELMNSTGVLISNVTFLNSPFWTVHPVYCSQVIVQNVTIVAPLDSPNTDGIDPDSSDDVCIEDCYISTGDDLIAIKSGWDEYGISYGRPSKNITIRRLVGQTRSSAGIAIGSEMSGGVSEVFAEDLMFYGSHTGIRIKTAPGRGGYVRNIHVSNVTLTDVDIAIRFTGLYGEHPDDNYDPNALPVIERITFENFKGEKIKQAGLLEGIQGDPFHDICLSNITFSVTSKNPWRCSYIHGYSESVLPEICEHLGERIFPDNCSKCYNLSSHQRDLSFENREPWLRSW